MRFKVTHRDGTDAGWGEFDEGGPGLDDLIRLGNGLAYKVMSVEADWENPDGNRIGLAPHPVGRVHVLS